MRISKFDFFGVFRNNRRFSKDFSVQEVWPQIEKPTGRGLKKWLKFKGRPIFPKTWQNDNGVGIYGEIADIRKNCLFSKDISALEDSQKTEKKERSRVVKMVKI